MSAEWQVQSPASWRVRMPCDRAAAERLALDPLLDEQFPAVAFSISEPDEAEPDRWLVEAVIEGAPDDALLAALAALVPGAGAPVAEPVEDEDWVTRSQQWLRPLRAGRFFVHTAAHAGERPADAVCFHIEASRAFGTGHHETTAGCLRLLDRLATEGRRFGNVADVGTGTGLLGFAAGALWPDAALTLTDIDPVAIEVAEANLRINALPADLVRFVVAPGVDDPAIAARAPFDLLIANILAGPLIDLAPALAGALAPGGWIMLAGLLDTQEEAVGDAYRAQGLVSASRAQDGHWPVLALVKAG